MSPTSSSVKTSPPPKDVRALARKAHAKTSTHELIPPRSDIDTALLTLAICAVSSYASQLSLSPVFGEIPSALYHDQVKNTAFAAAASTALALKYTIPRSHILLRLSRFLIPLIAVNIPLLQGAIWQSAKDLGAVNGPIVTEALTIGLLIGFTVFSIVGLVNPTVAPIRKAATVDLILLATSWLFFTYAEKGVVKYISPYVGSVWTTTRCGMEASVAVFAASLHRSMFLAAALPSFFPVFYMDSRCLMGSKGIQKLNQQLDPLNFTAIARIESNTGYLSVLENKAAHYRILRCDHSILGGIWLKTVPGLEAYQDNPEHLREPIYVVFVMLEAVRLIDPPAREREDANALVIGLGIGTSASGLIQHGIKTHIVEIDPGVYKFAVDHFGLPANHTVHIGDANYAGDLNLNASRAVIKTILSVFGACRAFREYPPEKDADLSKGDFTNMVIYCTPFHRPRWDPTNPYHANLRPEDIDAPYFRQVQEGDFLNTLVRRQGLVPQHEVDLRPIAATTSKQDIITTKTVDRLREWQRDSAILHWGIMNTVVPIDVWTLY
ncbi:hypothetical protein DRE_02716 [Drechslerella stenobrocha 248]|uniref:PABS domain-containing protein n=1 Tax=Drechslerella stenobrocha 248 TaxID=1043628 RepID=W7I7R2_9PEZI|nr:hypothetical protein DRE_02716 [Drechslerella stenobrocha 248]